MLSLGYCSGKMIMCQSRRTDSGERDTEEMNVSFLVPALQCWAEDLAHIAMAKLMQLLLFCLVFTSRKRFCSLTAWLLLAASGFHCTWEM